MNDSELWVPSLDIVITNMHMGLHTYATKHSQDIMAIEF